MTAERMNLQDALQQGRTLPWTWVRRLSSVSLGPVPEEIPLDDLTEARFFDPEQEIRIFRRGGDLQAVRVREEPGAHVLEKTYRIQNPAFGGSITVRSTLEADEDGQTFVSGVRLAGWKEERNATAS